jgi:hypothetical protein
LSDTTDITVNLINPFSDTTFNPINPAHPISLRLVLI